MWLIKISDDRTPPPPVMPPTLKKKDNFCLFHKGKIKGKVYTCPRCKTQYCMKCAVKARDAQKYCVKCKQLILI